MTTKNKKDIHGGNIWEAARITGKRVEDIIDFSSSVNPLGVPKGAARAIRDSIAILGAYPDPGAKALIAALSDYIGVNGDCLVPGNGSTELIHILPRALNCTRALIAEPAFSEYRGALMNAGAGVYSLRLRESAGFLVDPEALYDELKKREYGAFFMANPANPTGTTTGRQEVIEIAKVCAVQKVTLVIDEAFVDFNEQLSVCRDAPKLGNIVVLRSATKFFSLAGLRIGYVVSSPGIIRKISRLIPPWSINTAASSACIAALGDDMYAAKTRRWLAREAGFLLNELGRIGQLKVYPFAANYIMLKIIAGRMDAPELSDRLMRKGMLIRDLTGFIGLGNKYLRIAIKSHADNKRLLKALEEILA